MRSALDSRALQSAYDRAARHYWTETYGMVKPGGLLGVAHSAERTRGIVGWVARRVEDLVWSRPHVSLGCRPVSVLPRLKRLGARVVLDRRIGVPLWPFHVFVVDKPREAKRGSD